MSPAICVGAVILNWNRSADTIRAVRSLTRLATPRLAIVVVDNGSQPDDLAALRAGCDGAFVIANGANHGFARAVNIGARAAFEAGADHILLLNNDAYFEPGTPALAMCVAALEADPTLGAVGPTIVDDDLQRTIQSAGMRFTAAFPVPIGLGRGRVYDPAATYGRPTYLMGSCLLVRGRTFVDVGGLDADYFFFGEDIQLSLAIRARGQHEAVLGDTYIVHRKSSSVREGSWRYAYTAIRANLLFLKKNARWYDWPTAAPCMFAISLALCVRSATSWGGAGPVPVLRAWQHSLQGRYGGFDGTWPDRYETIDFKDVWKRSGGDARARAKMAG